jgi:[ribosomal protein S5]-alanine N-acetyltransferase
MARSLEHCGFGYWMICRRNEHVVLGICGVKSMHLHDRPVLNLLYRLDPSAWGNGIVTEAASEVVKWAKLTRPDRPVIARVRPHNLASARVAIKEGLERADHLDEHGEDGLDLVFSSG